VSLAFEESLRLIERDEGAPALVSYRAANPTHLSCLPVVVKMSHRALGLVHFYTADDREVRCFSLKKGKTLMEASACIDVHIMRNFIRGDVVSYADFRRYNGDKLKLMIDGRLKAETKKYIVNDGDIIEFFWHGQEKTM
jgi:ribosome-binding ATPase YchF (GTP1/OBG family)